MSENLPISHAPVRALASFAGFLRFDISNSQKR